MPTSSIFAGIKIDTPEAAEKFFDALNQAEEYSRTHVREVPDYRMATREDIRKMFARES